MLLLIKNNKAHVYILSITIRVAKVIEMKWWNGLCTLPTYQLEKTVKISSISDHTFGHILGQSVIVLKT